MKNMLNPPPIRLKTTSNKTSGETKICMTQVITKKYNQRYIEDITWGLQYHASLSVRDASIITRALFGVGWDGCNMGRRLIKVGYCIGYFKYTVQCNINCWCVIVTDTDIVTAGWYATETDINFVTDGWCTKLWNSDWYRHRWLI